MIMKCFLLLIPRINRDVLQQESIVVGANEENQEKAVPVKENENKQTFEELKVPASLNGAVYWLMCSPKLCGYHHHKI
jgi:hypothetical protein